MLRPFAHPVACCWMWLRVVAQSLKPVKLLAPCKWMQHCWLTIPNIVGSCCACLHIALECYFLFFNCTWDIPNLLMKEKNTLIDCGSRHQLKATIVQMSYFWDVKYNFSFTTTYFFYGASSSFWLWLLLLPPLPQIHFLQYHFPHPLITESPDINSQRM